MLAGIDTSPVNLTPCSFSQFAGFHRNMALTNSTCGCVIDREGGGGAGGCRGGAGGGWNYWARLESLYSLLSDITTVFSDLEDLQCVYQQGRKDMFYLTTHSTHFMYGHIWRWTYGKGKEMFYLMTHSTHFIYGYMTSDIG